MTSSLFQFLLNQNYFEALEFISNNSNNYRLWCLSQKYGIHSIDFTRLPFKEFKHSKITMNFNTIKTCEGASYYSDKPTLALKHGILSIGNFYCHEILKSGSNINFSQVTKLSNIINSGVFTSQKETVFKSINTNDYVKVENVVAYNSGIVDLVVTQYISKMVYIMSTESYKSIFGEYADISALKSLSNGVILDLMTNVNVFIKELIDVGLINKNNTYEINRYTEVYINAINTLQEMVSLIEKNNSINDTHFSFIDDIEISDSNGNLKCNASCTVATSKNLTNLNINLRKDNYSDVLKKLNDNSKLFIRNK